MSKALITATGVSLGSAGIAAGGIYLYDMFSIDYELPSTLEDLEKVNGGGCFGSVFPGVEIKKPSNLSAVGSGEISFGSTGENKDVRSCLVINWDKWKGTGNNSNKWRGNFRFLWSLAKGSKGFVVYATANTSDTTTDKKFKVKGIRYLLEENTTTKKWEIKKGKRIDSEKDLEASKLPKPDENLHEIKKDSQWNFAKDDANLDNLCNKTDCAGDKSSESLKGYWIFHTSQEKQTTADKWTSNLSDWWKLIFEEDSNWNMTTVLANIKGEWKNQSINWNPESLKSK